MNKTLIDGGLIPLDAMIEIAVDNSNILILAEDYIRYNRLKGIGLEHKTCISPCEYYTLRSNHAILHIIKFIIDDHLTYQLFDRTETPFLTTSQKITRIANKCEKAYQFLTDNHIDKIVFNATPHSCNNWILAKVAEKMGIDIIYFKPSVIPWRYHALKGLRVDADVIEIEGKISDEEHIKIKEFLEIKKGNLDKALPEYERKRLETNKGKFYSFRSELKNIKRPDLIINKYLCWKKYNKIAKEINQKDRYAVFFLHFQPERTTLPEGYDFSQQLLAVKLLRSLLDDDVTLVVKEHPSTFTNLCHWKERTISFYSELNNIKGVILAKMEEDQYKLIDNSILVASITGTVIFESVNRGTPAVAFGLSPYIKSDLYHRFSNVEKLTWFLRDIEIKKGLNLEFEYKESLENSFSINEQEYSYHQPGTNANHLAAAVGILKLL